MSLRGIPLDLSLLRQAVTIDHEFGAASLLELARVARFLEHAFYERRSLVRTPYGIAFTLTNPPLRLGAFKALRLFVDGTLVPAERSRVRAAGAEPVRFSDIDSAHPFRLTLGQSMRLEAELLPVGPGTHVLRLELQSAAIPPLVWIEIHDSVRGP